MMKMNARQRETLKRAATGWPQLSWEERKCAIEEMGGSGLSDEAFADACSKAAGTDARAKVGLLPTSSDAELERAQREHAAAAARDKVGLPPTASDAELAAAQAKAAAAARADAILGRAEYVRRSSSIGEETEVAAAA